MQLVKATEPVGWWGKVTLLQALPPTTETLKHACHVTTGHSTHPTLRRRSRVGRGSFNLRLFDPHTFPSHLKLAPQRLPLWLWKKNASGSDSQGQTGIKKGHKSCRPPQPLRQTPPAGSSCQVGQRKNSSPENSECTSVES